MLSSQYNEVQGAIEATGLGPQLCKRTINARKDQSKKKERYLNDEPQEMYVYPRQNRRKIEIG